MDDATKTNIRLAIIMGTSLVACAAITYVSYKALGIIVAKEVVKRLA